MRMIQEAAGNELKWEQPPMFAREYELNEQAGIAPLATLQWVATFGTRAIATGNGRTYTYEREGFLNQRIAIREGDSKGGEPLAVFKPSWNGTGTLTFANGRVFHWKSTNIWQSEWKWVTPDEGEIMHFARDRKLKRMLRSEAKMMLHPAAADFPEVEVLVSLGWYLLLLRDQDAASAVS